MNIELEIVSPNEIVAKESGVTEVIIPALWGQMDVLPQYTEYMTTLRQGELTYKRGSEKKSFNITGGLFTISKDKATVLIDGLMATVTSLNEARNKKK
jgi:F-type H+-transporting ATPase subunit epsilon